jgi:hypothetical protein
MWDYGERCWTKVSSVWIFLRFSGLMGFRFPREYVRDGLGFFFYYQDQLALSFSA